MYLSLFICILRCWNSGPEYDKLSFKIWWVKNTVMGWYSDGLVVCWFLIIFTGTISGEGDEKGKVMGIFRSLGALARAFGPLFACAGIYIQL